MSYHRKTLALLIATIVSIVASGNVVAQETKVNFDDNVKSVLRQRCASCHGPDSKKGDLDVTNFTSLMQGGSSGSVIEPGDPDGSYLYNLVTHEDEPVMPPSGKIPDAELEIIRKWIEMGAPDPRLEITGAPSPIGMSIQDGRKFWSFQPVINPSVPDLGEQDFVKNPIDAFILQKLMSRGLQPAPPAEAGTLARRLYMNVTGVPPTPEQLDRFLSDGSPGSTQKLIDRLLHSPAYGERWGRHWLDVARYADSNGLDENLAFGNAWRYRDYVIGAFNDDRAFNRFLMEQLAGDLLPDANAETRIATGFLVLGAKVLAEPDREKLTMDTIDEQIDATGKAFMGMSLGCVRCHDHKFDPIKQSDYYALAAIFKSTKTMEHYTKIARWWEVPIPNAVDRKKQSDHKMKVDEAKAKVDSFLAEASKKVVASLPEGISVEGNLEAHRIRALLLAKDQVQIWRVWSQRRALLFRPSGRDCLFPPVTSPACPRWASSSRSRWDFLGGSATPQTPAGRSSAASPAFFCLASSPAWD